MAPSSRPTERNSSRKKQRRRRGFELSSERAPRASSVATMAGWDEGNVYYTDLGDGDGRPGRDGEGVTPGQARRKFTDFLRNFRSEPTAEYPDGRLVYRDKLDQDTPPRDVTVLLDDIIGERFARGRTRIARVRAIRRRTRESSTRPRSNPVGTHRRLPSWPDRARPPVPLLAPPLNPAPPTNVPPDTHPQRTTRSSPRRSATNRTFTYPAWSTPR